MSGYNTPEEFANWMEAVADDAHIMANSTENTNDRHPMSAFLLGAAFAYRNAAYEARTIDD